MNVCTKRLRNARCGIRCGSGSRASQPACRTARTAVFRVLIFSLAALMLCSCRWVTRKEIIGYQGPARQDPFLAAERFLQKERQGARVVNRLKDLATHRGPLIASSQSFINYGDADAVLKWADDGGHLILLLDGAERWRNDWKESGIFEVLKSRKRESAEIKLLGALGISGHGADGESFSGPEEKRTARVGRSTLTTRLAGTFSATGDAARADVIFGDRDTPALASFPLGSGRVTVLANAHPFRNRWIGEHDHAALLAALVDLGQRGEAWFLNGARVSFWKMLWERGWMALVAFAAVFLAWLWKNLPRFGPLRTPPGEAVRDFTAHLALTGAFLWQHHEADTLLLPLRDAVTAAAARLGWHAKDRDFIAKIAVRSGLAATRVNAALQTTGIRERNHFLHITQDLRKIADALRGKATTEQTDNQHGSHTRIPAASTAATFAI